MEKQLPKLEFTNVKQFSKLREKINQEIEIETAKRIKDNPKPIEEEILIGAFNEMIEPQIRDAVFEFYRKGYSTESSGFGGENGEIQALDGYFEIDEVTKKKIEALDVKILKGKDFGQPGWGKHYTFIQFKPKNPNMNEIKLKWDKIAALLPQKNKQTLPSTSGASEDFRKQYTPERTDIEKAMLQKRLKLSEYDPKTEQKMRQRLKEL